MADLYYRTGEVPAELPSVAHTPSGEARSDLANHPDSREECGFQLAPGLPAYQAETQGVRWSIEAEAWEVYDLPPAPPPPELQPRVLGKLEFITLCQTAGGMTDDMLVSAQENLAFKAFWIKYQMASAVERDSPVTDAALAALEGGHYLPNGDDAVRSAWPTQ